MLSLFAAIALFIGIFIIKSQSSIKEEIKEKKYVAMKVDLYRELECIRAAEHGLSHRYDEQWFYYNNLDYNRIEFYMRKHYDNATPFIQDKILKELITICLLYKEGLRLSGSYTDAPKDIIKRILEDIDFENHGIDEFKLKGQVSEGYIQKDISLFVTPGSKKPMDEVILELQKSVCK